MLFITLTFCLLIGIGNPAAAGIPVQIHVHGIDDERADKNVRNTLNNMLSWLPVPTVDSAVRRFALRAPEKIQKSLQPFGYFNAKVSTSLKQQGQHWVATFNVDPGQKVTIASVKIRVTGPGKDDVHIAKENERFPLRVGDPLETTPFERAKLDIYEAAQERGYFNGKFSTSKIVIDLKNHRASILLVFNTGERSRYGSTSFSNSPFADSFIRRFLSYRRGEYYDLSKSRMTQRYLTGSPYFAQATVRPQLQDIRYGEVPIHVNLIPRKKRRTMFGLGWGTDTGLRGTLGMSWRYVNKLGHRFKTLIRGSERNTQMNATYTIPGFNPVTDSINFTGGLQRINQTTGVSNNGYGAFYYKTMLGGWQQTLSLNYLSELYEMKNQAQQHGNLIYPSIVWSRLYLDSQFNPTKGYDFYLRVAATPITFGPGNQGFLQARARTHWLVSFLPGSRLLMRAEAGYMDIQQLNNLPLSLQMFAGGARSVRGYTFNSLGPGRELFTASIELQQHVWGNFFFGVFFDVGNVANKNLFQKVKEGVGPSVIWMSPVGMMELSIAKAISQPNSPWVVQFSMGPIL